MRRPAAGRHLGHPLAGRHRRQSGPPRAVLAPAGKAQTHSACSQTTKTVWPSGLRRWLQAPVRKGVGSNPTAVTLHAVCKHQNSAGGSPQAPSATEVQGQLRQTYRGGHRSALPGAGPVQRLRSSLLPELTRTSQALTVWPSGLRRWLKAPVRKGVGSNPTAVTFHGKATAVEMFEEASQCLSHNAWLCEVFML